MPTLETDGTTIHFGDFGEGEPIVLIHGAASSGRCFADHVELLREMFRVIVPDLRGMGRSTRVRDMPPGAWCEDLRLLLDHLALDRVHLCGTSLGARVALRFALDLPKRVLSAVADSPIIADSESGSRALEWAFGVGLTDELAAQLRAWNGDDWEAVRANYLRIRRLPGIQDHYDISASLEELSCPLLVTRGDVDDDIHPLSHAVEIHARVSDSQLWIAPATTFTALRSRPQQFVEVYRAFLEESTRGQAIGASSCRRFGLGASTPGSSVRPRG